MDIYQKITNIIKQYKKVVIMTHKNPDLDGLSSSICLYEIIKSLNIPVYLYKSLNITNASVIKMFKKLEEEDIVINSVNDNNYIQTIDSTTLLIILDVNNINLLENKDVLNITSTMVIDHHIKPHEYIKNTTYSYVNSNLSSISEFMTNYVKNIKYVIKPLLATILLAAIEIDTNNFNIKTSEETYLSAAYLMKIGADNVIKQELLKENKGAYLKRQDLLKTSFMLNGNTALCVFDNHIYKKEELAITAEELLQFENVDVSYVVGKIADNKIGISARSLGNINVEKVMKKFGGGGHLTEAASEISSTDINEIKKKLINEVIK